jgi:hypothetical protein
MKLKKPRAIAATSSFSINVEGIVLLFIKSVLKGELILTKNY